MRLITRGGYNWTGRIVEAARKIRQKHFVLDGEAVVLGVDGISEFCAFDILAEGGDDLRISRCRCGRRTWSACWHGALKAFSSIPLSAAGLGLICFARPVNWG